MEGENLSVLELGAGGGQAAVASALWGHSVTAVELMKESAEFTRQPAAKQSNF